jgi:hypothetical protein
MLSTGSQLIRNNVMRNCITPVSYPPDVSLYGFDLSQARTCDTCLVEFDHNVIESCQGNHGTPGVMVGGGNHYAHHNRFTNILPAAADNDGATWTLRDNLFYGNQLALVDTMAQTDARWNWWGDSTGPYHGTQNPSGQGDTIRGNVDFSPWYADTTFFHPEAVPPARGTVLPKEYSLTVYPNPFNPVASVRFGIIKEQRVTIDVFNLAGQRVRRLCHDKFAAGYHTVTFDGQELPSGIYFAKISAGRFGKTEKMVLLK